MPQCHHLVKLFVKVLDRVHLFPPKRRGRPFVYSPKVMLKCSLVMVYYRLTSLRSLERFLHQDPTISQACGLTNGIPSYRTFSRRFRTLEEPAFRTAQRLIRKLVKRRWIKLAILVTDASLLAAKGRAPRKGAQPDSRTSDREAGLGYSSVDQTWVWGYKLHLISTSRTCMIPLLWQLTTANRNEGRYLATLLSRWPRYSSSKPWLLADTEYDSRRNVQACQKHRLTLVSPIKRTPYSIKPDRQKRLKLFRKWNRRKRFRHLRADIERLLAQLKDVFLLDPLPVKGLAKVQTYLSLVMLAYLAGIAYNGSAHRGLRAIKSLVA